MTQEEPRYQVRIFLREEFARAAAQDKIPAALKTVLEKHGASIDHNQFEEFSNFLRIMEQNPPHEGSFPARLYKLTKESLANPEKVSWFKREFTIAVGNRSLFAGVESDALIADLLALDGTLLSPGKVFTGDGQSKEVPAARKSYAPAPGTHPGA